MKNLGSPCLVLGALLTLIGCHNGSGGGTPHPPSPPTFSLRATPDALRIPSGGSAYVVITLSRLNGFAAPVELDIIGGPVGLNAKATMSSTDTSTMLPILLATGLAPQSLDQLQLRGTAGSLVRTVPLRVQILEPLPPDTYPAYAVQAAGTAQGAKDTQNQAVAGEGLQAAEGTNPTTCNRSGFHPTGQPKQ